MKQVNKWLQSANNALITSEIISTDRKVKKVFKGYISSFGAMVIQNGLPAALAINMKSETEEEKQRKKIVIAIADILKNSQIAAYDHLDANGLLDMSCHLANNNNQLELRSLKEDVINASISLKLMLRTYEFVE